MNFLPLARGSVAVLYDRQSPETFVFEVSLVVVMRHLLLEANENRLL